MIRRSQIKRGKRVKKESMRYELILGGAVIKYPDGREVCQPNVKGRSEYERRTWDMYERQERICCICKTAMLIADITFEHTDLRGMGEARRDDRIEIDGKPVNGAAHGWCNAKKGSKRA